MKKQDNETLEFPMSEVSELGETIETKEYNKKKETVKVTCLGITFNSEEERRNHFREELRKHLPELKKLEGFPIGEDDDIINLSDPPYYTACPNPWLNEFIAEWEMEKFELEKNKKRKPDFEVHEPYASDVSEGKNNPIYNAHSYHTKVPHPAIMRYILHYTQPGDIVFDGFAGTGMTGVAAQLCGHPDLDLKTKIENEFKNQGLVKPAWGARKSICGDLSPIASFIAYNYNTPVDVNEFEREAKKILKEIEDECGWMYDTIHINPISKKTVGEKGRINYTVWSDVFICPNCGSEIIFWEAAVDMSKGQVLDEFPCKSCHAKQTKRNIDKAMVTLYDKALDQTIRQAKTVPVFINYTYQGKRFEKTPDNDDIEVIKKINEGEMLYWYPMDALPNGYNTRQPMESHKYTHVHHFYTKRNLWILSLFYKKINEIDSYYNNNHRFIFTSMLPKLSIMNRFMPQHGSRALVGPMANTLYIPSLFVENEIIGQYEFQLKKILKAYTLTKKGVVNNTSATEYNIEDGKVDYIFVDPPFGANIMYSEVNYIAESWIKIITDNKKEAIENKVQNKGKHEYQMLMLDCFNMFFKILKSGKWMTVEFSNTSSVIWNTIHYAIQRSGFVIANVSAINKERPGLQGMIGPVAVNQDLVISCYKPSTEFDKKFKKESYDVNVWSFVEEHLNHLPIMIVNNQKSTSVVERNPKILYDRMITFYLMRNLPIPIDAADFQIKLKQKFSERDGMYFLSDQAVQYDKMKKEYAADYQPDLFNSIYTENDAIFWLKQRLEKSPQKYQDIQPEFRKANVATRKGEKEIELQTVLAENFIEMSDSKWRLPDPNEAKDREILRTKSLIREFNKYIEDIEKAKNKKIKDVRVEALRAGFKYCWDKKDFVTIINVGDAIPNNLLMEDEQLLMFYDIAKDKI